jgi:hypothetical protein
VELSSYFFLFGFCETIGTAATPGLLSQPQVIVKMIVESRWNVDWQGKPKFSEKTCPSATFVHHKIIIFFTELKLFRTGVAKITDHWSKLLNIGVTYKHFRKFRNWKETQTGLHWCLHMHFPICRCFIFQPSIKSAFFL